MNLKVNGSVREVTCVTTLEQLLKALGIKHRFIAVALNGTCVLRKEYATTEVRENDEIEILSPQQGG